jgi:hypothetical protein
MVETNHISGQILMCILGRFFNTNQASRLNKFSYDRCLLPSRLEKPFLKRSALKATC